MHTYPHLPLLKRKGGAVLVLHTLPSLGVVVETLPLVDILDFVVEMTLSLMMGGVAVETLLSVDILGMVVLMGALVESVDVLGEVGDTVTSVVLLLVVMVGEGVAMLLSVDVLGLVGVSGAAVVLLAVVNSPVGVVPILLLVEARGTLVVRPGRRAHFYSMFQLLANLMGFSHWMQSKPCKRNR